MYIVHIDNSIDISYCKSTNCNFNDAYHKGIKDSVLDMTRACIINLFQ